MKGLILGMFVNVLFPSLDKHLQKLNFFFKMFSCLSIMSCIRCSLYVVQMSGCLSLMSIVMC